MTVLAMHQPNYVPWPGYFHKLAHCDVFVYLDAVQYPRGRSFAARNRIKTPNGPAWLTIPVSVPKGRQGKASYREVELADERWRDKHLRTVEQSYKRAPHFEEVFALYRQGLERGGSLVELNVGLIDALAAFLGIEPRRVLLSEALDSFGEKTDLIVELCGALGADVYLAGAGGGREYTDEAQLTAAGIELRFDEYAYPEHPQLWDGFEPNLSVLDLLFNCGADGRELVVRP